MLACWTKDSNLVFDKLFKWHKNYCCDDSSSSVFFTVPRVCKAYLCPYSLSGKTWFSLKERGSPQVTVDGAVQMWFSEEVPHTGQVTVNRGHFYLPRGGFQEGGGIVVEPHMVSSTSHRFTRTIRVILQMKINSFLLDFINDQLSRILKQTLQASQTRNPSG